MEETRSFGEVAMNQSTSFVRIAIIVLAAGSMWFLSTFVPSPYKTDTALVPLDASHKVSRPEPLSDASVPTAPLSLATVD